MNIVGIDYESVKDGEGVRAVIYVSGCNHGCKKCHNPETHNTNYGFSFTEELQKEILSNIAKRPYLSGITWSGGDPLHSNNIDDVLKFTNRLRLSFPSKTIWLYSGYTWEQLFEDDEFDIKGGICENQTRRAIVLSCGVFVDGRYEEDKRDITLKWRGSSNQRVIDVQKSLIEYRAVLYCD